MPSTQTISETRLNDISVIVRCAGERTEDLSYQILCGQVPQDRISVIKERPFTRALRKSFEIGIKSAQTWTLCVDADVLLRQNGVQLILQAAQLMSSEHFQIQAEVIDKLFMGPRQAGNRLYRTSLLPEALTCIPPEGTTTRPETYVVRQMADKGYPYIKKEIVVGVHDFHQYHRDIYRKAFVHAHKHSVELQHYFESLWKRLAGQDPDFRVALWGLRAGRIFNETVELDVERFPKDIDTLLLVQGWQEKSELGCPEVNIPNIDGFIDTYESPPEYWSWRKDSRPREGRTSESPHKARFGKTLAKTGWGRIGPWYAGRALQGLGRRIRKWSES